MGYNSYNDIGCSPNSTWMDASIRAMSSKGLVDLGYDYFQIDCGWQGFDRLPNGSITYDASFFPDGIQPLSNLARDLGMKWSMYTDQGVYSCDTRQLPEQLRPGSLGYEKQDAIMFAAWNTQYVKVDNCYIEPPENAPKDPRTDFPSRFAAMWNALQSVNIPEMLICQWGIPYINPSGDLEGPAQWTTPISTSYRMSDDIASGWENVMRIVNEAIHINLKGLSGPGHFADMDLLEVGNPGMTLAEQKSHFSLWAAFKSALMISTDVPNMSPETHSILSNKDIIAINQDPLGQLVKLTRRFTHDHDVYAGPLANNDQVVLLLDTSNTTRTLSINLTTLNIKSATLKDLWTGTTHPSVTSYTATVPPHGCIVLRLSNIVPSPSAQQQKYECHPASTFILSPGTTIKPLSSSTDFKAVLAPNGTSTLTIPNITTSATTTNIRFDYINAEIGYTFADKGPNVRGARISVNGGEGVEVLFPVSGYDWERDVLRGFLVRLGGFVVGQANTISVEAVGGGGSEFPLSGWGPEIVGVGVVM